MWPLSRDLKPNVKSPLKVPLIAGGSISLTIDEIRSIAFGRGDDLRFVTDQLAPQPMLNCTGNLQSFRVLLSNLNLQFDPKTGKMPFGTATLFVMGEPYMGGAGAWNLTSLTAPSYFIDRNSPSFDISNGLDCGGGIVVQLGTSDNEQIFFTINVEGRVSLEDIDGDGKFEVACKIKPSKPWLRKKPPFPPDIPTVHPLPPVKWKKSKATD